MTGAAHQPDGLVAVVRGSGIPIVLLHGLSIDHRMMLPIDPIVAATGPWQRYYVDLPGHGRSAAVAPMTIGHIVDVVATHLRAALRGGRFAVIGASFGGAVAIALTEMFGDRVLGSALLAPAVLPRRLRTLPPPRPSVRGGTRLPRLAVRRRSRRIRRRHRPLGPRPVGKLRPAHPTGTPDARRRGGRRPRGIPSRRAGTPAASAQRQTPRGDRTRGHRRGLARPDGPARRLSARDVRRPG